MPSDEAGRPQADDGLWDAMGRMTISELTGPLTSGFRSANHWLIVGLQRPGSELPAGSDPRPALRREETVAGL